MMKAINVDKVKELDSHWNAVMELARKFGFVINAYGGLATLATNEEQIGMFGEEGYLKWQHDNGIDIELCCPCCGNYVKIQWGDIGSYDIQRGGGLKPVICLVCGKPILLDFQRFDANETSLVKQNATAGSGSDCQQKRD